MVNQVGGANIENNRYTGNIAPTEIRVIQDWLR